MQILKLYHTVKYLRPVQIFNRFYRVIKKIKLDAKPIDKRELSRNWLSYPLSESCYIGGNQYKFLNVIDVISNWNDEKKSKLWNYNLHYFDDLNRLDWQERNVKHISLINTWIEENPLMHGNGWEPYPLSLRIVNWIKWFLSGNAAQEKWFASLTLQTQALQQQLEYHLLGNHIFANAKALVFSGCYFKGEQANIWLIKGLKILEKEIPEQILPDGGHFELSPMYHNIILSDMLDLVNLGNTYSNSIPPHLVQRWSQVIIKMLKWREAMTHPDGEVSFFNDSAFYISPSAERICNYADMLGIFSKMKQEENVTYLKDSGYIKLVNGKESTILDVAKVGPDYIPGHAHADTLSFEWNYDKQRVFVNSGTSVYGLGSERLRQRKTESHNTVVIDDEDSSEVWSGFRVARRAYPSKPIITESGGSIFVECSHDGYMRLRGKVTHTRKWMINDSGFSVTDKLLGSFNSAQAHYHFHPDIQLEQSNGSKNQLNLYSPDGTHFMIEVIGADIKICDSTWHPEFGVSIVNKKIVLNFKKSEVKLSINMVN
ncbi:heparinase II/III family protein [Shewanella sp. 10N.286.48.B5]|uniref:heparinase II/III family protein n=1 Tax=Shewanella sp. 10N.286.48.B5 TaxID=1880834 RepID=UPI0018E490E4|nr:alginate lyase family protein [Shewanella sp. 10N.286.48.B5]